MASSTGENADLLQAAERVWGALDHMVTDDPEGYREFIGEQLREGKEVMTAPEPIICVRCSLEGVRRREYGRGKVISGATPHSRNLFGHVDYISE